MKRILFVLLFLPVVSLLAQELPKAPVRDVVDTYFGVDVHDPYRYMEDLQNEEVSGWIRSQDAFSRRFFNRIKKREALRKELWKLNRGAEAYVGTVIRLENETFFYTKMKKDENTYKLYKRIGLQGEETLLVDPDEWEKKIGTPHAINYYTPSFDGRYVAFGISEGGSEEASLYIMDTKTGQLIGEPVDRVMFGVVQWLPDNRTLFFHRLRKIPKGMDATEKYQNSQTYRWRVGEAISSATAVLGIESTPELAIEPTDFPIILTFDSTPYIIAIIYQGVQNEFSAYIASVESAHMGIPRWRPLCQVSDQVENIELTATHAYLLTHKEASRYQVIRVPLDNPDLSDAELVYPETQAVITNLVAARDALYIRLLDGGLSRIERVQYDDFSDVKKIPTPVEGQVRLGLQSSGLDGILFNLVSWTRALRFNRYDAANDRVFDTGLQPVGKYDEPDDLIFEWALVESHDGTRVPLSIVYKKGLKRDGKNPVFMTGYGAYGVTQEPHFDPALLPLYNCGGVYAVAHVRGGGEYGKEWHLAGQKETKPNTWKDFIACAEYLVQENYTCPGKMGCWGGSAGGILVGRVLTERPDLFAAVIPEVGALDMVRFETTPNGVPNISEFGTVKIEEKFHALLEMSAYHHVRDGTDYPAVLLIHGMNDPRVEPWHSAKMAARLQAATASETPILLSVDMEAGHGRGSTKKQRIDEMADIFSFLFWRVGVKGFELK